MPGRVLVGDEWLPIAEAAKLLVVARTYKRDQDGQFSSGGGGESDDEDTATMVEPSIIETVTVGYNHVRAVDDSGGVMLGLSHEPGVYVSITQHGKDPVDDGTFYSPSEARSIAAVVDGVAATARSATSPVHPADLDADRPPAYGDGPALLAHGHAGDHPIAAYHDAYGDLVGEGESFVVIGKRGTQTADWSDNNEVHTNLKDAGALATALRDMADVADRG